MADELAIYGGPKTVEKGLRKNWPPVDEADEKMVLEALRGTRLSISKNYLALEDEFCAWNGNQYAIFTNSGTAALHMCIAGCGVSAGDHVLVTAYSWSSSATCILHHNAIPIFVDINPDTFLIDPDKIEAAITPRTKAIVVVQLHGLCDDMDKINAIAKKHGLKVIEDACQAHGATYKGRHSGTLGDCAAFSFNQNKSLSCGEGGMFVTDNEQIYKAASKLWSFGESVKPDADNRDYHAYALGWMYRSNEITAAFMRAQLAKADWYIRTGMDNGNCMYGLLKGIKGLKLPYVPKECEHNWYNFNLRINFDELGFNGSEQDKIRFRNAVCNAIMAEGAFCSVWQRYILPEMTVFQAKNAYGHGNPWSLPGADEGVDYTPSHYPNALNHSHIYISMGKHLRAPNGKDLVEKHVEAVRKVFENLDKIDVERIEAIMAEKDKAAAVKRNNAGLERRARAIADLAARRAAAGK